MAIAGDFIAMRVSIEESCAEGLTAEEKVEDDMRKVANACDVPPQVADRGKLVRYEGHQGNEIPGVDENWLAEGTPNNNLTQVKMSRIPCR